MLSKIILIIGLLQLPFNIQSQNIDTLIHEIKFSIIKDTTSKITSYSFKVQNKSKSFFYTEPFGLNINKVIIHNSVNQRISHDFISCGNYDRINIEPDSSFTWKFELLNFIPDIFPFQLRRNQIDNRDSLYFLYWMINNNTIGPIKYYPKKDLLSNLSSSDKFTRNKSANFLRSISENKFTLNKSIHSIETPKIITNDQSFIAKNEFESDRNNLILKDSISSEIEKLSLELNQIREVEDSIIIELLNLKEECSNCFQISEILNQVSSKTDSIYLKHLLDNMELETKTDVNYGDECIIYFDQIYMYLDKGFDQLELELNEKIYDDKKLLGLLYSFDRTLGKEASRIYIEDRIKKTKTKSNLHKNLVRLSELEY